MAFVLKTTWVLTGLLVTVLLQPVLAEGFDRGRELYENHCQECHESWAHERNSGKVATIDELRQRVAGWSIHSRLQWGDEEIDDVTGFLAREFYQINDQP